MDWMRRMMYGRYGVDQLSFFLVGVYLVGYLLESLLRIRALGLLSTLCLLWALYRTFSRQLDRRRMENDQFLEIAGPIIHRYTVKKCRRRDKEHRYFKCPNCGQQLRVPRGKGRISITCRSCGVTFEEKT